MNSEHKQIPMPLPQIPEHAVPGSVLIRFAVRATISVSFGLLLILVAISGLTTIRVAVHADGILEPASVWAVRPATGGVLTHVYVQSGDTVRAGQVVARLDSIASWKVLLDVRSQLSQARLSLQRLDQQRSSVIDEGRAAIALAQARVNKGRSVLLQRMTDFGVTGDVDSLAHASDRRVHVGIDGAAADLQAAFAELEGATARLRRDTSIAVEREQLLLNIARLDALERAAGVELRRHILVSPARGVVLTEQTEQLIGAALAAGQSTIEIADLSRWRAHLAVDERDVHRLQAGTEAVLDFPAVARLRDEPIRGLIESIALQRSSAPSTSTSARSTQYHVTVVVDSLDLHGLRAGVLRRGFLVRGRLITDTGTPLALLFEYFRSSVRSLRYR